MKKLSILFLLLLLFACKETETVAPETSIYGSWYRSITDDAGITFNAELKINEDDSYNFIVLDENTGHTDSYAKIAITDNSFQIIEDNDCNVIGKYEFLMNSGSLALIAVDDECLPRISAIQGVWKKNQ